MRFFNNVLYNCKLNYFNNTFVKNYIGDMIIIVAGYWRLYRYLMKNLYGSLVNILDFNISIFCGLFYWLHATSLLSHNCKP